MNWRPKNWGKVQRGILDAREVGDWATTQIFEAGADAILKALKEDSGIEDERWDNVRNKQQAGWIVFIPSVTDSPAEQSQG